jgi:arginine N-succinyltransferase
MRYLLRPSKLADLPQVEQIAAASAIGIGSLPPDRERLYEKIRASAHAFAADVDVAGEESYFFVLEEAASGQIVGVSGITACAGFKDRFYSYRNELVVHRSPELGIANRIHTLHLCHDLSGHSLLTSFYIAPELEATPWPQLLSRGRLLFIAEHPRRFADRLAAESPGLCDENGRSPFWDAVGRRFFDMDYPQAEQLAGGRAKSFIADLLPHSPVYVPLLPEDAQLAIGQLHPVAELPFSILTDEGFEAETYVDVFDGGPTVEARLSTLRTFRAQRRVRVDAGTPPAPAHPCLVANTGLEGWRATLTDVPLPADDRLTLPREVMLALDVSAGDDVRVAPLMDAT